MPTLQCPICQRGVVYQALGEVPFRPFCCERCRQVDLGRWLSEEYRISEGLPGADEADHEQESEEETPREDG